jgi:predicted dehydrogenase
MVSTWAPQDLVCEGQPGAGMRVAVAGASHWHLPRYARSLPDAGATFVGVSDPDPGIAARWAGELNCLAAATVAELLERTHPDVVLALGRVVDMPEQALTLIRSGVPVLAEKPLGLSANQVATIASAAANERAWVAVALVQRYDPLWASLDELRKSGRLGDVTHLHMRIINGPPGRYVEYGSGWMLRRATSGGGALRNLGIHGVDYFLNLAGEPVAVRGAAITSRAHQLDVEDFGSVILRSSSGIVGTIEAGYTYPDATAGMTRSGDNETRIGANGAYVVARDEQAWILTADGGEEHLPSLRRGDRYRDWVFDSLARLRDGRPPLAGVEDCLAAMRLLDDAYATASQ